MPAFRLKRTSYKVVKAYGPSCVCVAGGRGGSSKGLTGVTGRSAGADEAAWSRTLAAVSACASRNTGLF